MAAASSSTVPVSGTTSTTYVSFGQASVWHAPLVPAALSVTAGIVLDRYAKLPLLVSLLVALAGVVAWVLTRRGRATGLALVYLALAATAFAAAYHHWHREVYRADDIGNYATPDPRPVQARGVLEEEPTIMWQPPQSPLQSIPSQDPTVAVLRVTQFKQLEDWLSVSGRARLIVSGHLEGLHVGDEVEVVGRLVAPHGPANPGEFDYASYLLDQRVRAQILVVKTTRGVTRLGEGWHGSPSGWLAVVRGWGQRTLAGALPHEQSSVAGALLLGDGSTMTNEDWQKYIRTGVIHVLAISGQHLVVLAGFLWWTVRLLGIRRSQVAWFVAIFLLGYALLTGGRPPVMRSAATVCAYCGALMLRRLQNSANSYALGWLTVTALNPTDLFNSGCQLSFLSVAVLYWGTNRWLRAGQSALGQPDGSTQPRSALLTWLLGTSDPLEQLIDESRPWWLRFLRKLGRDLVLAYAVTLAIWLALIPLVASRYNMVSFVGILLGPPTVFLTSIALVAGFLLLLLATVCTPLVPVLAWVVRWCLVGCDGLVYLGDNLPGGHWYLGDVPDWWLWVFYPGLLAVMILEPLQVRWRWALMLGLSWLCVGLIGGAIRPASDELRCTFLAVGHGGCTVLESPDGRTLLYDAGALNGPEVTRRQIAPYLWHRGIRRIDEILLSHADLDHFNGLPALLDRFSVGHVTCTPTFADKNTPGVTVTLAALERKRIPLRVVRAGDRLAAGPLLIDVLHPPAIGPDGNENARSMVLLVQHAGHRLLLTGDLEGAGLDQILASPATPVDVLMAPHHGSRFTNKPELARWAQPKIVVSCEGPPRGPTRPAEPYSPKGATFLGTWPHGAVTIHSHSTGLVVETFQSKQRFVVR